MLYYFQKKYKISILYLLLFIKTKTKVFKVNFIINIRNGRIEYRRTY